MRTHKPETTEELERQLADYVGRWASRQAPPAPERPPDVRYGRTIRTVYGLLAVGLIGWAPNAWLENPDECQHPTGYPITCYYPGMPEGSNQHPASQYTEYVHETYGFYPNDAASRLSGKIGA